MLASFKSLKNMDLFFFASYKNPEKMNLFSDKLAKAKKITSIFFFVASLKTLEKPILLTIIFTKGNLR